MGLQNQLTERVFIMNYLLSYREAVPSLTH